MRDNSTGFTGDVVNWLRGLCMGAADIVPGVSGGTMALILGHYQRLVTAISRIDTQFLSLLAKRQLRQALEHIDFRFLLALTFGMASGIVALASLMHYLLEHQLPSTYAIFTGLILASSALVARRIQKWSWEVPLWLAGGILLAWQISVQQPVAGELTPLTAFLSATVAICAMILPGISGAFVLLLLGVYHPVTELIKGLPRGEITLDGLIVLATFGCGCLVGLLAFSRILKWLLANRYDRTLAFLVGLMLGSLVKIWPFQRVSQATAKLPFKEQQFEYVSPFSGEFNLLWIVGLVIISAIATLGLEQVGKHFQPNESASH